MIKFTKCAKYDVSKNWCGYQKNNKKKNKIDIHVVKVNSLTITFIIMYFKQWRLE